MPENILPPEAANDDDGGLTRVLTIRGLSRAVKPPNYLPLHNRQSWHAPAMVHQMYN